VKAGHAIDTRQAFDRYIGVINRTGGIASLAHPGLLRRDDLIPGMIDAGLTALEAFHSDHDTSTTGHYLNFADRRGILVSGGSDYHGEQERRRAAFGTVGLPAALFEWLKARVWGES
jgi:predicted metal-dependent phosphoesterase TrpH